MSCENKHSGSSFDEFLESEDVSVELSEFGKIVKKYTESNLSAYESHIFRTMQEEIGKLETQNAKLLEALEHTADRLLVLDGMVGDITVSKIQTEGMREAIDKAFKEYRETE